MIRIRGFRETDLDVIRILTDRYISVNFYTEEYLRGLLNNPDHTLLLCEEDATIGGYFYGMRVPLEEASEILHLNRLANKALQNAVNGQTDLSVGIFKTAVLSPEFRGKHASRLLMEQLMNWFGEKNVSAVLCEALVQPDQRINIQGQLEAYHFKPLIRLKHPWSSIKSWCPYCHQEFCTCDAVLFIKY